MITVFSQNRSDIPGTPGGMPAQPDAVSVALEASVSNDRAQAMIRASWGLVETYTGRNFWPVTGAMAMADLAEPGEVQWPRHPFPAAITAQRWQGSAWEAASVSYIPELGVITGLTAGRLKLAQVGTITPEPPNAYVIEAARALALYQLIHSPARREFRTMSTGDSTLTREALDGLFRASGAGVLLAGLVRW